MSILKEHRVAAIVAAVLIAAAVVAGVLLIGGGESARYFVHLRFGDELPDIEDIERSPSTAKLPPKRDGQMVVDLVRAFGTRTSEGSYQGVAW